MNLSEETVALLSYLEKRGLTERQAVDVMEFAIRALTERETQGGNFSPSPYGR